MRICDTTVFLNYSALPTKQYLLKWVQAFVLVLLYHSAHRLWPAEEVASQHDTDHTLFSAASCTNNKLKK